MQVRHARWMTARESYANGLKPPRMPWMRPKLQGPESRQLASCKTHRSGSRARVQVHSLRFSPGDGTSMVDGDVTRRRASEDHVPYGEIPSDARLFFSIVVIVVRVAGTRRLSCPDNALFFPLYLASILAPTSAGVAHARAMFSCLTPFSTSPSS